MTAPARFRQNDIARVLKAASKSGFESVRVQIGLDGRIDIIVGKAANDAPPAVELD